MELNFGGRGMKGAFLGGKHMGACGLHKEAVTSKPSASGVIADGKGGRIEKEPLLMQCFSTFQCRPDAECNSISQEPCLKLSYPPTTTSTPIPILGYCFGIPMADSDVLP